MIIYFLLVRFLKIQPQFRRVCICYYYNGFIFEKSITNKIGIRGIPDTDCFNIHNVFSSLLYLRIANSSIYSKIWDANKDISETPAIFQLNVVIIKNKLETFDRPYHKLRIMQKFWFQAHFEWNSIEWLFANISRCRSLLILPTFSNILRV